MTLYCRIGGHLARISRFRPAGIAGTALYAGELALDTMPELSTGEPRIRWWHGAGDAHGLGLVLQSLVREAASRELRATAGAGRG